MLLLERTLQWIADNFPGASRVRDAMMGCAWPDGISRSAVGMRDGADRKTDRWLLVYTQMGR